MDPSTRNLREKEKENEKINTREMSEIRNLVMTTCTTTGCDGVTANLSGHEVPGSNTATCNASSSGVIAAVA